MEIHRVNTSHCAGGENPLWDVETQSLYFIDNSGRKIHCYNPVSGTTQSWAVPENITALALRGGGGAIITLRSGIYALDLSSNALEAIAPLANPPPLIYNDGKVDQRGRFIIGGSTASVLDPKPDGGLFRLDPDYSLHKLDGGIHFSNGPCWSPDAKTLYFSDSWLNRVYAYDYDIATGAIANKRLFVETAALGGVPDGATVDSEGCYWTAIYGGAKIASFKPGGELERVVEMPVQLVSSVMFGGPNLDLLYVTTIECRHDKPTDDIEPGAGDVYVVEGLGVRGLPEAHFAG